MTWAPPCLLSSHPDPGNRFGVCYILFRRSAENDQHQRKRGNLRPSTQVDKPDPPLQEINIGIGTKSLVEPDRIRSSGH